MKLATSIMLIITLAFAGQAMADERPEHFEGESAETLDQALANIAEYNQKLSELVARDELGPRELHEVHQLTYTLENALERVREEQEVLAAMLEEVHLASEEVDAVTVRKSGEAYLELSGKLIP